MSTAYMEMWRLVAPEVAVALTALCVLSVDLAWMRHAETRSRSLVATLISVAGCAIAIGWILHSPLTTNFGDGLLVLSPIAQHVQVALLALTVLTVLLASDAKVTNHISEYLSLMLLATVGMMLLVSTQNLLLIFLSLELLSLSLYVLAAFDRHNARSAEAALKYFLFGATSAAFLLFGFSLLYGLSNSTNMATIASTLHGAPLDPLLLVAIVMTLVGLGFKVAAVPFHFWVPDVYQGAPVPSAALIASGSKVAGFFILYQVLVLGLAGAAGSSTWHGHAAGWMPVVAVVAALSMVLGNLVAILQTSVRRLLAYSAIGHAGYMLLSILAHTNQSFTSLLYYAITYALTVLGAFGVVAVVEQATGGDTLAHFAGLSRRAPLVSMCMLVFMLSLAGIPPLAGFFGKFYVFASALSADHGLLWLVVLAIAMSVVSLYYYLKVLKSIYVGEPASDAPVQVPMVQQVVLGLIALGVVVLGCAPDLLLRWL